MSEERQQIAAPPKQAATSRGVLQRKCACGGTPGPTGECAECRRKRKLREQQPVVQRKAISSSTSSTSVAATPATRGGRLPEGVRQQMERHFHTSFANVQVHADPTAGRAARRLGARAFTSGSDIYFAPGQYQTQSRQGLRLLAHELTHVVQQRNGRFRTGRGARAETHNRLEEEADRMAQRFGRPHALMDVREASRPRQAQCNRLTDLMAMASQGIQAMADTVMEWVEDSPVLEGLDRLRRRLRNVDVVRMPAPVAAGLEQQYDQLRELAPWWVPVPNLQFTGTPTQQDAGVISIPVSIVLLLLALVIFLYWYYAIWMPAVQRGEPQRAIEEAAQRIGELIESIPIPFSREDPLDVPVDIPVDVPVEEPLPEPEPEEQPRDRPGEVDPPPLPPRPDDWERQSRCRRRYPSAIPIWWPFPLWHIDPQSIDDPGSEDSTYDLPAEEFLVKRGSTYYDPNRPEIGRYVTRIQNPPFRLTRPSGWPVHHKWPLYLGGPGNAEQAEGEYDAEGRILSPPNLVVMSPSVHRAWHRLLEDQPAGPSFGQGPSGSTPDGTQFCVLDLI